MSKTSSSDTKDEQSSQERSSSHDSSDTGRSGEGAASAMARLILQGQEHRHQAGEADDAAGSHRQ